MSFKLVDEWHEIELKSGKTPTEIREEVNAKFGTSFQANWIAKFRQRDGQPRSKELRRHMLEIVLTSRFERYNIKLSKHKIKQIVDLVL